MSVLQYAYPCYFSLTFCLVHDITQSNAYTISREAYKWVHIYYKILLSLQSKPEKKLTCQVLHAIPLYCVKTVTYCPESGPE